MNGDSGVDVPKNMSTPTITSVIKIVSSSEFTTMAIFLPTNSKGASNGFTLLVSLLKKSGIPTVVGRFWAFFKCFYPGRFPEENFKYSLGICLPIRKRC